MTQYKRITGKVFGGNATATGNDPQIAQFGSALAGTFIGTTDPQTIQQLPAWGEGWSGAVTPETQFPPMPEMTGAMKVLSHQICGILQQGVSTWDSGTIYYTGNFCSKNGAVYVSLTDENQGNDPVSDTANWRSYGGANLDLSNLSAVGEKHFLNKTQITNCLLEVPQTINLEIVNGELVLKKGSTYIMPNGANNFERVTITEDLKRASFGSSTGDLFIQIYRANSSGIAGLSFVGPALVVCSTTQPEVGKMWYDLTNNKIYNVGSTGLENALRSFPFAIVRLENGVPVEIKQVFNGFGYFGSVVWIDKGLKVLIPNGRNEDGTLKNIEVTSTQFSSAQVSTSDTRNLPFFINQNGVIAMRLGVYREQDTMPNDDTYLVWFDTNSNLMKRSSDGGATWQNLTICYLGDYQQANSSIHTFETKKPFRAVDYSDKAQIVNWGMPDYSSGIEPTFPFTAPSDGVLYFSLLANNASGDFYINGVFVAFYADNADGAVRDNYTFIVSKGDVVSGFGFEFARFFPLKGAK